MTDMLTQTLEILQYRGSFECPTSLEYAGVLRLGSLANSPNRIRGCFQELKSYLDLMGPSFAEDVCIRYVSWYSISSLLKVFHRISFPDPHGGPGVPIPVALRKGSRSYSRRREIFEALHNPGSIYFTFDPLPSMTGAVEYINEIRGTPAVPRVTEVFAQMYGYGGRRPND